MTIDRLIALGNDVILQMAIGFLTEQTDAEYVTLFVANTSEYLVLPCPREDEQHGLVKLWFL